MGKIEMFRKALALPEVIQSVELTEILKELYTDHLELLDRYNEAKEKLNKLGNIEEIKKKAKIKSGFYTIDCVKDVDGNEIKFCLNCLYEHGLQIPMLFGVVKNGTMDLISGQTVIPTIYGLSCKKCGTHLAVSIDN